MTTEKQKTNAGAANGASAGAQALEAFMAKQKERQRGGKVAITDEEFWQAMVGLKELVLENQRLVGILYERETGVKPKKSF